MMYNYKQILDWKYINCDYTIADEYDYDTLVWNSSTEKPSRELLETKIDLIKASELLVVRQRRATTYPSIQDQLDMLWHMMDDATIPGKGSEWYNAIKTVKDQFPKQ